MNALPLWLIGNSEIVDLVSNTISLASFVVVILVYINTRLTKRALRKREEEGKHYENVKSQVLETTDKGEVIEVGIRDLEQTSLDDVLIGSSMPEIMEYAVMHSGNESSIFRMPSTKQQDLVYRDFVGHAGKLLPDDAEPHVLVLLSEPAHKVERRLVRACLYSSAQVQMFASTLSFVPERGKEHQKQRIIASKEIAKLIAGHNFEEEMAFKDADGFVIAHLVKPGAAAIPRVK